MTPNGCTAISKAYNFTEVLHYEDATTLVTRSETVRRAPDLAVSRVATTGNGFRFWNDHDPRIVAVEFIYSPA